jgi:hypothetical protein
MAQGEHSFANQTNDREGKQMILWERHPDPSAEAFEADVLDADGDVIGRLLVQVETQHEQWGAPTESWGWTATRQSDGARRMGTAKNALLAGAEAEAVDRSFFESVDER